MQQPQHRKRRLHKLIHPPIILHIQCLTNNPDNTLRQFPHQRMIRIDRSLEAFRIPHLRWIFIRSQAKLLRYDFGMVERQIEAEIESFFQIALGALFEVLGAEALVAAVETADVWERDE